MADRDLNFRVRAEDQASRVFKDAEKAVKDLGTAEDETRTKAERLADEMKATADKIDAELADARDAADVLGQALGAELVADIQKAGGSVDGLVANFKNAGLTYDEVRADADTLAAAIKRVGDIGKTAGDEVKAGAREAETGLEGLDAQADQTQASVRRVGDSSDQSRSVLANMVGNSTQDLAQLGGVAGTAGMALGQIGEYATEGGISLGNLAKVAGPMIGITAAVMGISSALEAMGQHAKDVKRQTELLIGVQEQLADGEAAAAAAKLTEEYKGTIKILKEYGLGAADLVAHMKGEIDLSAELERRVYAQTDSWAEAGLVVTGVTRNLGEAEESWRAAGEEIAFNTAVTKDFERALTPAKDEVKETSKEVVTYSDAANTAKESTKNLETVYKELTGTLSDREAWLGVEEEIDAYKQKINEAGASNREKEQALIDLKQKLIEYLGSLEDIPAEQQTRILSLIDQGKFEEAEKALAWLGRQRDVTYNPRTGGQAPSVPKFDSGGVMPGPRGQHNLALVAGGETILPTHKGGVGLGGNVYNINVTSADPGQIIQLIKEYERRNGSGWRR